MPKTRTRFTQTSPVPKATTMKAKRNWRTFKTQDGSKIIQVMRESIKPTASGHTWRVGYVVRNAEGKKVDRGGTKTFDHETEAIREAQLMCEECRKHGLLEARKGSRMQDGFSTLDEVLN